MLPKLKRQIVVKVSLILQCMPIVWPEYWGPSYMLPRLKGMKRKYSKCQKLHAQTTRSAKFCQPCTPSYDEHAEYTRSILHGTGAGQSQHMAVPRRMSQLSSPCSCALWRLLVPGKAPAAGCSGWAIVQQDRS